MNRIYVYSRKGHFDLCHPSVESVSTHIGIKDGDKEELYCNITTDDIITDSEPEYILDILNDFIKHIWINTARKEIEAVRDYIHTHLEDLQDAKDLYDLEQYKKKRDDLNIRIANIEKRVSHLLTKE